MDLVGSFDSRMVVLNDSNDMKCFYIFLFLILMNPLNGKAQGFKVGVVNIDSLTKHIIQTSNFDSIYRAHKIRFDSLESHWAVRFEKQFEIDQNRVGCGPAIAVEQFVVKWKNLTKDFDSFQTFIADSLPKHPTVFHNEVATVLKNDASSLGKQANYNLVIDTSDIIYSTQSHTSLFSDSYIKNFNLQKMIKKFEHRLSEKYSLYSESLAQGLPKD